MTNENFPKSAEDALELAMSALSDQDKERLLQVPEAELGRYHFSLGATIRNRLGLWRGDAEELLSAIARSDPTHPSVNDWGDTLSIDADGASALLLRMARRRLVTGQ